MIQLSSSKVIAKNTIFLYFRMALIMIVSLYTVRVVLQVLGVEDYGIYNAIGGVVTSMSFLTNVLSNASNRFFTIEIGKGIYGKVNECFSAIFLTYLLISLVALLIIGIGGTWLLNNKMTIPEVRSSAAVIVMFLSLASFIISILATPFQALLIAKEEMSIYAYVSIFEALAKLAVVYFLQQSHVDKLILYAVMLLIISILTNGSYFIFSRIKIPVRLLLRFDKTFLKSILNYSSWTLFGTVSGVASMQGSSVLMNIFVGPVANAAFAIATQVSTTIQTFASSFYTAVRPPLIKSYASGENGYMMNLFTISNKTIFVLTFLLVFPIMMHTEFIINLWLGEVSPYMIEFVRLMLIYSLILCLSYPITTLVQAAGKVKLYHGLVDGFALIILPLNYMLFHYGLCKNASIILMIMVSVFALCHLLRLLILKKVISFSIHTYIKEFVFPSCAVVVICYLLDKLIRMMIDSNVMIDSLIIILLDIFIVLFSSIFIIFSKSERMSFIKIIHKK